MSRQTAAGYVLVEVGRYTPHPLDGPDWEERELADSEIEHQGAVYDFTPLGESWLRSELNNYCSAVDHFGDEMEILAGLMSGKDSIITVWKQIAIYEPGDWISGPDEWLRVEFVGVADMSKLPLLVKEASNV